MSTAGKRFPRDPSTKGKTKSLTPAKKLTLSPREEFQVDAAAARIIDLDNKLRVHTIEVATASPRHDHPRKRSASQDFSPLSPRTPRSASSATKFHDPLSLSEQDQHDYSAWLNSPMSDQEAATTDATQAPQPEGEPTQLPHTVEPDEFDDNGDDDQATINEEEHVDFDAAFRHQAAMHEEQLRAALAKQEEDFVTRSQLAYAEELRVAMSKYEEAFLARSAAMTTTINEERRRQENAHDAAVQEVKRALQSTEEQNMLLQTRLRQASDYTTAARAERDAAVAAAVANTDALRAELNARPTSPAPHVNDAALAKLNSAHQAVLAELEQARVDAANAQLGARSLDTQLRTLEQEVRQLQASGATSRSVNQELESRLRTYEATANNAVRAAQATNAELQRERAKLQADVQMLARRLDDQHAEYKARLQEAVAAASVPRPHASSTASLCRLPVMMMMATTRVVIKIRGVVGRILGINTETKAYDVWVPDLYRVVTSRNVQNVSPPLPKNVQGLQLNDDMTLERPKPSKVPASHLTEISRKHVTAVPERRQSARLLKKQTEGEAHALMTLKIPEPRHAREALTSKQAKEWEAAMKSEIDSLIENGTWELVARPPGANVVGHRWVFKVKFDSKGEIERYKARLVAKGYAQKYGIDFTETFSPVIRQPSVRVILVIATTLGLEVIHLDVPQAYVKANLDKAIYMTIPALVDGDPKTQVLLLLKSLYGLKQSGRMWHAAIDKALRDLGFSTSPVDPCLYYMWTAGRLTMIGLYVDDVIAISQDAAVFDKVLATLKAKFNIKTLGPIKRCLGINVHRSKSGMFLEQTYLIDELLAKHKMSDCHPQSTPLALDHKIFDEGGPCDMPTTEMREIVGSLLWLSSCTRPDIAYATNLMARHLNAPNEHHGRQLRRILRYLKATRTHGLQLAPTQGRGPLSLDVFSDADWAGDKANRRSTSGCIVKINGAPVHWFSKQQSSVALSTMEAEYVAASIATQEAIWIKALLEQVKLVPKTASVNLWCDNQSALQTMEQPTVNKRSKHIDIRYHFVREAITSGCIKAQYCKTGDMPADCFTKALPAESLNNALEQVHVYAAARSKVMLDLAKKIDLAGGC